jgi:hypothetical protein
MNLWPSDLVHWKGTQKHPITNGGDQKKIKIKKYKYKKSGGTRSLGQKKKFYLQFGIFRYFLLNIHAFWLKWGKELTAVVYKQRRKCVILIFSNAIWAGNLSDIEGKASAVWKWRWEMESERVFLVEEEKTRCVIGPSINTVNLDYLLQSIWGSALCC